MTKRDRLMVSAIDSAKHRGHTLSWIQYSTVHAMGTCTSCNAWVQVLSRPRPNQIDIGGPAVAENCRPLAPEPISQYDCHACGSPLTAGDRTIGDCGRCKTAIRPAGDGFTDVRESMYVLQARVTRVRPDGYTETIEVPTFYLSAHQLGITDREHAERIGVRMLQDLVGSVQQISVSASPITGRI